MSPHSETQLSQKQSLPPSVLTVLKLPEAGTLGMCGTKQTEQVGLLKDLIGPGKEVPVQQGHQKAWEICNGKGYVGAHIGTGTDPDVHDDNGLHGQVHISDCIGTSLLALTTTGTDPIRTAGFPECNGSLGVRRTGLAPT